MAPRTWTEEQKETQRRKMREHHARRKAAAAPSGRDPIPGGAPTEETPPSRGEPRAFAPLPDPEPGVVREPDPTPGARAKRAAPKTARRTTKSASTDSELASMLGKLLSAPAVPAAVILKCEFCAAHFAQQAGPTAHELVKLSADSPELRGFLEDLHGYYGKITWAGVIGGYLLKPIAHHVAPNPLLHATHGFLGVPPRPEAHTHTHSGPAASPFMFGAQPPAAGPPVDGPDLAGMDLGAAMAAVQSMDADQLMATAAQFGITVEPGMLPGDGIAPSDSTDQPSEPAPAEPVTGTDTGQ